jgi:NADH-quinone oxidoreductase subunit N
MLNDFLILMRLELLQTALVFLLLFIKLGKGWKNEVLLNFIYLFLLAGIVAAFFGRHDGQLFAGMFVSSKYIFIQKTILNLGVLLIALLNYDWLRKHEHLAEFFMLLMSAQLGLFLMISSGNLLIFYLSLELASIPVAALANFDLERRTSSEAAMKMILSSAFSSGILLFGISLLYGASGTIQFEMLASNLEAGQPLETIGFILFFAGLAFKLSVVPFHLWTADVYEGSPVAVTSFLSVISKGATVFVFVSLLYKVFNPLGEISYQLLLVLSVVTLLVGNLFALRQNNLKRFLAFSSIAQVGFMLVGISGGSAAADISVTYFLLIYVFSNLAAFGVIGIIGDATGRESVADYRGLYKNNKLLSWVMAIALFSLAGVPPTAGFFGKFFLIMAGAAKQGSNGFKTLFIAIVAINLVISLYYYLRLVRAMFMDSNENPVGSVKLAAVPKYALLICVLAILLIGLFGSLYEHIRSVYQSS